MKTSWNTMKSFSLLLASALLVVGGVFSAVFVNLTVDPPEVESNWPCVSNCQRDASGIAFTLDDTSFELEFFFIGLPDDVPIFYVLSRCGAILTTGEGTILPLSDYPLADHVEFFSSDSSVDWFAVNTIQAKTVSKLGSQVQEQRDDSTSDSVAAFGIGSGLSAENEDGQDWEYTVTVTNAVPGFSLYGVSDGTETITNMPGPPICSGEGPYYSNVCEVVGIGPSLFFDDEQYCEVSCSSDDTGFVQVGNVAAHSSLQSPAQSAGYLAAGVNHGQMAGFASIGGPYAFNCKIKISGVNPELPRLVLTTNVVYFSTKNEATSARGHEPHMDRPGRDGHEYTIVSRDLPAGCISPDGVNVQIDRMSDVWKTDDPVELTVMYELFEDDKVIDSAEGLFIKDGETTKDCPCDCGEKTSANNDSVDFSQAFGRTPWIPNLPVGKLCIKATSPSTRLGTPAALFYDHPMRRRIVYASSQVVVISGDAGDVIEYGANGLPRGSSLGADYELRHDAEGCYVEVLPDRTELRYSPQTRAVTAIRPPDGEFVPVESLGITYLTDQSGAITNITSIADGEMSVETISSSSYCVTWRDTAGGFVKSFTFEQPAEDVFTLHEYRDETFNFRYRWRYDDRVMDWELVRGAGTGSATRERKVLQWNNEDKVWNIEKRIEEADGTVVSREYSSINSARSVPVALSKSIGNQNLAFTELDETSGRVAIDGRIGRASNFYVYDEYGRVLTNTTVSAGGLIDKTIYAYAERGEGTLERRPLRTTRYLNNVIVSDVEMCYGPNFVSRTRYCGAASRTSFKCFDSFGRITLEVSEDARARKTEYSEMDDDYWWTKTETEGVWQDGEFLPISGKSERRTETIDESGNVRRIVTEAFVDDTWVELNWVTNRYNATHKVVFSERSDGRTSAASWICTGSVWERNEDGIEISNRYDSVKRKISSTRYSPWGDVTTDYIYDAAGRIVREIEHSDSVGTSNVISRVYDERGRVISETDAQGRTTHTRYSNDDLITTTIYADGGTRITTRNADGSLCYITGTAVTPEFYTYGVTESGLEWTCTHYGRINSPRYEKRYTNAFGENVRIERSGYDGATIITENVYDNSGHLISTVETGMPTTTYTYDVWGERISTTQSADGISRISENEQGYQLMGDEVWRVNQQTIRTSDTSIAPLIRKAFSKVSGLTLECIADNITVDVRCNTNRVTTAFDPTIAARTMTSEQAGISNRAISMTIDNFESSSVGFNGASTMAFADAYGRELTHRDGRGNITRTYYDDYGRVASQVDAAGSRTSYGYDAMGRQNAITNALGLVTTYEYDLRGNKTYEGGTTYPVRYTYDTYGNRTSMTTYRDENEAEGDTTSWEYDEASGLVVAKHYADGTSVRYTYTADGKLLSRTWARGVTTTYAYDGWGNLVTTTYSDNTPTITLAYDALGRLVTANDVAGATTYSYDEYGDESQVSISGLYSKTLIRHRDEYGRDLGHTMDGSRKNIIEYEPTTGRIKRTMLGGAWFTWDYLAGSDLKSRLTYGGSGNTEWTYEQNRDLLTRVKNTIYGAVVSQYDYTNDAIGRRTAIGRSGTMMSETRNDAYGYNARSELTNAVKNATLNEYAYQYDDIGNRKTSTEPENAFTYTANELNQYTQISEGEDAFTPTYDADGNQTLIRTKTGVWSVTYNGENRPVLWTCGTTNLTMKFDRMGRRVEYIECDGAVTNKHQKFVYDGYLCIQRLNGANNSITELFEWDPTEPVATRPMFMQYRVPGQTYALFYTHDGNKNVSEVVHFSRANGVAAHYEYAPFGEVTAQVRRGGVTAYDFSAISPWRFSSEYADDALGLVYYNYRHYNLMHGRWFVRDGYDEDDQVAIYCFLRNRVNLFFDALGAYGSTTRPPLIRSNFGRKRNPGNRKLMPPSIGKKSNDNSLPSSRSENADVIEAIGNALDEIADDVMDDNSYSFNAKWDALSDGKIRCAKKFNSIRRTSVQPSETTISARQCKCCEVVLLLKSWIADDVGGDSYAIERVTVYVDKDCDQVKKQDTIDPVYDGVKRFRYFYSDF